VLNTFSYKNLLALREVADKREQWGPGSGGGFQQPGTRQAEHGQGKHPYWRDLRGLSGTVSGDRTGEQRCVGDGQGGAANRFGFGGISQRGSRAFLPGPGVGPDGADAGGHSGQRKGLFWRKTVFRLPCGR